MQIKKEKISLDKSHTITNNFHSYNSVKYTRVAIQQAHDTVCVRVCTSTQLSQTEQWEHRGGR